MTGGVAEGGARERCRLGAAPAGWERPAHAPGRVTAAPPGPRGADRQAPPRPTGVRHGRRAGRGAAAAPACCCRPRIGNCMEWFDFGAYSYLASPAAQVISSFATFAAAFVVRPLGGLFFGPLGDRIGQRHDRHRRTRAAPAGPYGPGFLHRRGVRRRHHLRRRILAGPQARIPLQPARLRHLRRLRPRLGPSHRARPLPDG